MNNIYVFLFSITLLHVACSSPAEYNKEYEVTGNVSSIKIETYHCDEKFGEIIQKNLVDTDYMIEALSYIDAPVIKVDFDNNNIISTRYNALGKEKSRKANKYNTRKDIVQSITKGEYRNNQLDYTYREGALSTIQSTEDGCLSSIIQFTTKDDKILSYSYIKNIGKEYCDTIFATFTYSNKADTAYYSDCNGIYGTRITLHNGDTTKHIDIDKNNNIWRSALNINKLKHREQANNGPIWTFKYSYDNAGNWIERVMYKDDKPMYLTKRTITYNT